MKIFLLPGQSIKNKEWIYEIATKLKEVKADVTPLYYSAWDQGNDNVDVENEVKKLVDLIGGSTQYIIFAKSIGTVIALKAIYEGKISPKRCYFVGLPYDAAIKGGYDYSQWIESVKLPIAVQQKRNDPFGPFEYLKEVIKNPNFIIEEYRRDGEPMDDHHYADTNYIKLTLMRLANAS